MIQTRPMTAADWPAVEIILAAGIAGGEATFETTTPSWERFDAGKVTDARLVAIDETFGFLFGHLEHEFFLAVFAHLIEFVGHLDKLSFFNFVHIVDFCCFKS